MGVEEEWQAEGEDKEPEGRGGGKRGGERIQQQEWGLGGVVDKGTQGRLERRCDKGSPTGC